MNHFKLIAVSCCLAAGSLALQGCDRKEPPVAAQTVPQAAAPQPASVPATTPPAVAAVAPAENSAPPTQQTSAWTPTALETLLAPIALYPDGVLAQVLATSTKPQEVLDGGNWLLANNGLQGAELEQAAQAVGFTPPMIALMQFPSVLDMMCLKMEWTTELGSAFLADEAGVLAAVQRLRKQAADMGNLKDSGQLDVENITVNNQDVITVKSPDPKVVYVPQYDPVTTYTTPAPAAASSTPATSTAASSTAASSTATATTTTEGHSTAALVTTGLLAFGAGILVNEAFDDDDDDHYYPYWGGGGGYAPVPYYPVYGNGHAPSYKYNNNSTNNIYVNTGNNTEWKGKGSYDGARPKQDRPRAPDDNRPGQSIRQPAGSYAGANRPTRDIANDRKPAMTDRGRQDLPDNQRPRISDHRDKPRPAQQPARQPDNALRQRSAGGGALQGINNSGASERAASQRGKTSRSSAGKTQRSGGGKRR